MGERTWKGGAARVAAHPRAFMIAGAIAAAGAVTHAALADNEIVRDAPHGALAMPKQEAATTALLGPTATATPKGVDAVFFASMMPKDNALDARRIALGKKLYFDPRLSRDGTVACATCHDVSRGFTDRRAASEGIGGKVGRRNAPTTMNAVFFQTQFWDGRAGSLEEQAKLPITNPIEMGQKDGAAAVAAIAKDPEYVKDFRAAYGREPSYDDIGRALAAFERTLVFLDAPYDRFVNGDVRAISDDAKAGWVLFNGKARCVSCHQFNGARPIGTNDKFHNIGVSARHQDFEKLAARALKELEKSATSETIDRLALETDLAELGRFVVTRNRADIGAFKTSQLRNIGVTAPYMHDGSMATLWDVVDHYNKGGEANRFLDGAIEPLNLSDREVDQLVAFLFTLTDVRFDADNRAELARQRAVAEQRRPFRDPAAASRGRLPFEDRARGAAPKGK
ncbi:Cytochrome c551 peroxidase [Minicystis rosea]|nr:Cytochrome c551 peroxidase [Minicystis rosea]